MHANAASSDVTLFPGPGTESVQVSQFKNLGAAMPSILMTENGALVCVGVGTGEGSRDTTDGKSTRQGSRRDVDFTSFA